MLATTCVPRAGYGWANSANKGRTALPRPASAAGPPEPGGRRRGPHRPHAAGDPVRMYAQDARAEPSTVGRMWTTRRALASLSLVIGVTAAGPEPSLASQSAGSPASDDRIALQRLLVAVPDPGAVTPVGGGLESAGSPPRLRLADPSATVVVADRASDARSQSGPFWFAVTPAAAAGEVGTRPGGPSSLDIGVSGPGASSAPLVRVPLPALQPRVASTPTVSGHLTMVEVLGGSAGIVAQPGGRPRALGR